VAAARTILVTGASGVVGRAIVEQLTGQQVIALVHESHGELPASELHACDMRRERLGLDLRTWEDLARRVEVVVHSAALTEWGMPAAAYEGINVEGTRRVIELARRAEAPLHYVGTSFVRAIERGGAERLRPGNVVKSYIASKLAAERLLAGSGVPHSIFRPTNLIGDSASGASLRPQIVQAVSDWICRGKAPFLPAHPGNLIDVVPLDTLALAVANAAVEDDVGRLYWVAGGAGAPSAAEVIELLVDHAAALGREIGRPPVVDPRHLPRPLRGVTPRSRAFLEVLVDVSEVTHECGGVLPSSLGELAARLGVPRPDVLDAYRRSLEFWAQERRGARAEAA